MTDYFDEAIVAALRKGQPALALRELYRAHYAPIMNMVCTNSGTEQEAKDVYQESLIIFYEKIRQPHFTLTCRIGTYLYAVCRRLWLKRLAEKRRFDIRIDAGETVPDLEETLQHAEDSERKLEFMGKSLDGLGEPCRSIIEDFYIRDLSMETIRDKHGYTSADNAKNQKYKCLQRLKKIFFAHYNTAS
jgi:RNA polymerase sigma factor (sigma-70 family)